MLYIGFFEWITIRFTYFPRCSRAEHSPLLVRHPKLGPSGVFIIISTRVTENGLLMVSYNRARVFHLKYLTSLSSIMCSQLIPNLLTEQVWSSCIYALFTSMPHQLGSWAGFGNNFFLFQVPWDSKLQSYFSTWEDGQRVEKILFQHKEDLYLLVPLKRVIQFKFIIFNYVAQH